MLNSETKRHIDAARDVLVGVAPNPTTQIDQITYALIYKFMDDMDQSAIKAGGEPSFFTGDLEPYAWSQLMNSRMGNQEKMNLYGEALTKFSEAKQLPELFRTIFRAAYLPYRSPETLGLFLKEISYFDYSHPEELGNAYEYLLSIMSSQGDAGQFRTPRHIIDFIVDVINPTKDDKVLDPACGTAGFLVSTYNHILEQHDGKNDLKKNEKPLTPDERKKLMQNLQGYDIDPTMVRIAQVNMYLHQFKNPQITQYDALTSEEKWSEKFDVILANPPFMSPKGGIKPHNKFSIPSNRAEVLFVDYIINHLKPKGRAGIIVPEGIIFQSGNAYKALRKSLVENGLYAVVSLPGGVFQPYSGVKTSILLFDNEIAKQKSEILFIKISADGFDLGASKRIVSKNDLPKALEVLQAWQIDKRLVDEIASWVPIEELAKSGNYNLSAERYRAATDYSTASWDMVPLQEICKMESGSRDKGGALTQGVFSIGGEQIGQDGKILFEKMKYISPEHFKNMRKGVLLKNDVLIVKDGATTGKIGFWDYDYPAAVNEHVFILRSENKILPKYLLRIVQSPSFQSELGRYIKGIIGGISLEVKGIEIPLPPLEVQEQMVAELDGYAAIISGAKQIVENWNPRIEVESTWEIKKLGQVLSLEYGKPLKQEDRIDGPYPVFGSNGVVGFHNEFLVKGPFVIVGRKGSAGAVTWSDSSGYPIDTTFYVNLLHPRETNIKFVYFILSGMNLDKVNIQSGVPGLNRNDAYELPFPVPALDIQNEIVNQFAEEEIMVRSAESLIQTYEFKTQAAIAKLWSE